MNLKLQDLKIRLDNFKSNRYQRKKYLQEIYDHCKEVYDTITVRELNLIWFLRNSRKGVDMSFLSAAKLNYEAHQAQHDLFKTE